MLIESIMTKKIITVRLDHSLGEIKLIFDNVKFHHLLVQDGNRLVGIISDRDLLKELSPNIDRGTASYKEIAVLSKKAHQIMSTKLITIPFNATIKEVIATFLLEKVSCLPVIGEDGSVAGVVSWKDIFLYMLTESNSPNC